MYCVHCSQVLPSKNNIQLFVVLVLSAESYMEWGAILRLLLLLLDGLIVATLGVSLVILRAFRACLVSCFFK